MLEQLVKPTSDIHKETVETLVYRLRNHKGWKTGVFLEMERTILTEQQALIFLCHYKNFVSNFFLYMLRVVSSSPKQDHQFDRLSPNIWDELGAEKGLDHSHGSLLNNLEDELASNKSAHSYFIKSKGLTYPFENKLGQLLSTDWPLNLFSLGPGTESISYLFLRPIEQSCRRIISKDARLVEYFHSHEPEIEFHHQDEILNAIAFELGKLDPVEGNKLLANGEERATKTIEIYQRFITKAWVNSKSYI